MARMGPDPRGSATGPTAVPPIGGTSRGRVELATPFGPLNVCEDDLEMKDPLRVLIADDHPLFLFAIAHSVNAREELELVGQAKTGREAIAAALETQPDLAVLDVEMPDLDGLDVLNA